MDNKKRKMKRTVEVFKPMPMWVNREAFKKDVLLADTKMSAFNNIVDWVSDKVTLSNVDLEALNNDVLYEFKRVYTEENKGITNTVVSFIKMAFLMDLDITPLEVMAEEFYSIELDLVCKNGEVVPPTIREKNYTTFTTTTEQNNKLDIINRLNGILDEVSQYRRIHRGTVVSALNGFCGLEFRGHTLILPKATSRR